MASFDKDVGGNIMVRNYGLNPAVNFNFMLRVEGLFDLPCKSVHSFRRENEYETIQEGGLNDYVHMRRKPISKPFTFQVERYVGTDILDPLANGTDLVLPVILFVSRGRVYQEGDTFVRMYTFTGCTVMAKEYGELNAEKGGLLVETTTIGYREMICVENIAASFQTADEWDPTKKKTSPFRDEENQKGIPLRIWPGESSAVDVEDLLGDVEPKKPRIWPGTKSAVDVKDLLGDVKPPKPRIWPETRSAVDVRDLLGQPEPKKPRVWPDIRSAEDVKRLLEDLRKEIPRLWPTIRSAVDVKELLGNMNLPAARTWPGTKSAVDVKELLGSLNLPAARTWPGTKSAVDVKELLSSLDLPAARTWPGTKNAVDVKELLGNPDLPTARTWSRSRTIRSMTSISNGCKRARRIR